MTFNANAVSPGGLSLSYEWSQPDPIPARINISDIHSRNIQVNIPSEEGDYFLKVKVADSQGRYEFSGCLIRSTFDAVRILNSDEHPAWVDKMILYEVNSWAYFTQPHPLKGIISKLDYIADLGINAVWLTPLYDGEGMSYWVRDNYKIKSELGTDDDLKELVTAAHAKGIKVILDLVINHSWTEHPFFKNIKALNALSPFADYYIWSGVPGESSYDYYYDWVATPNFNVNNNDLKNYLFNVAAYWLREFNIDGYRCDVAQGIERRNPYFWSEMRTRLKRINPNIFLLAEAPVSNEMDGSHLSLASSKFDAAYDWDLRGWTNKGFPDILTGNSTIDQFNTIITTPPEAGIYALRFIENHDLPRAAYLFGIQKSKLAHTIILTLNGIPLIYGGGEMGELEEWNTPAWTDPSNMKPFFKKLIEIRNSLLKNNMRIVHLTNTQPQAIYSYISELDSSMVFTIVNFSDQPKTFQIDFNSANIPIREYNLQDLFSSTSMEMTYSMLQANYFSLDPWQSKVYLLKPSRNLVLNGSFSDGMTGWSTYVDVSANATFGASGGILDARITNGGTQDWHVQLLQTGKKIESGKIYDVSFDASADGNRTIRVGLSQDGGNYQIYDSKTISLTTGIRNNSIGLRMNNPTDENARLFFNLGGSNISVRLDNIVLMERTISSVSERPQERGLPRTFTLEQNYPNPFNPTTKIKYSMPKSGLVQIIIYNLSGQAIATLVDEEKQSGNYEVEFDGSKFSGGVYVYKMQADNFKESKKFILLK